MLGKFNDILKESLSNTQFKRVRLKSDPLNPNSNYEGYVIEEQDDGMYQVFVISNDSPDAGTIQTLGADQLEFTDSTNLCKFKEFLLEYLKSCGHDVECIQGQMQNVNSLEFIEAYLKEEGFDDNDLLKMYRCFVNQS